MGPRRCSEVPIPPGPWKTQQCLIQISQQVLWPRESIGGDYIVTLGRSSGAETGSHDTLPTLKASVGAFTRLWLGVRPATGLAVTDELKGPEGLLRELDWALRLPEPNLDWDF